MLGSIPNPRGYNFKQLRPNQQIQTTMKNRELQINGIGNDILLKELKYKF